MSNYNIELLPIFDWTPIKANIRRVVHTQQGMHRDRSDGTVTFEAIFAMLHRQNYLCALCHFGDLRRNRELDHIIPISRRGRHTISNVQWTCSYCNRKKNGIGRMIRVAGKYDLEPHQYMPDVPDRWKPKPPEYFPSEPVQPHQHDKDRWR